MSKQGVVCYQLGLVRRRFVNTGFLYGTNEIIVFFGFFALMLAATEAGFRLGRKSEANTPDKTKSLVSAVGAAILGVLGLLLGFTMSMAVSRFEARKHQLSLLKKSVSCNRFRMP
jgi:hypothetical protein